MGKYWATDLTDAFPSAPRREFTLWQWRALRHQAIENFRVRDINRRMAELSPDDIEAPPNWIELPVELPDCYKNWVKEHCKPEEVKSVPAPHMTLFYGFEPARYLEVKADVEAAGNLTDDWEFPEDPRPGDFALNAWLLPVRSRKVEALFWRLSKKYSHCTFLRNGTDFDPHITLCYTKDNIPRKEASAANE